MSERETCTDIGMGGRTIAMCVGWNTQNTQDDGRDTYHIGEGLAEQRGEGKGRSEKKKMERGGSPHITSSFCVLSLSSSSLPTISP